jgi:peptidyl-dipeptidase Dcp
MRNFKDENGETIAHFYLDPFSRPETKSGGAWMNEFATRRLKEDGTIEKPLALICCNQSLPDENGKVLMRYGEVETLFHEFGHALHGLMSKATYKSLAGTNTPRDFVELPSQFMENYCYHPEVLKTYAFHYQTGELIPEELIAKINKASTFNQGFVQTELLSASILDMDYHKMNTTDSFDVNVFEEASMENMHMIPEIITRYRSTFYNHIFTTGYAAGYYSYTWAAVLDADAFAAFEETGDIFNPEMAAKFQRLLEQGGTRDAALLYQEFRGKNADPKHLLKRCGF